MYRLRLTIGIWAVWIVRQVLWPVAWVENEASNIHVKLWNDRVVRQFEFCSLVEPEPAARFCHIVKHFDLVGSSLLFAEYLINPCRPAHFSILCHNGPARLFVERGMRGDSAHIRERNIEPGSATSIDKVVETWLKRRVIFEHLDLRQDIIWSDNALKRAEDHPKRAIDLRAYWQLPPSRLIFWALLAQRAISSSCPNLKDQVSELGKHHWFQVGPDKSSGAGDGWKTDPMVRKIGELYCFGDELNLLE